MKAGAVGGISLLSQQPWSEVPLQALAGSTVRGVNTFFPQELWLLSFFRPPTGGGKEKEKDRNRRRKAEMTRGCQQESL